MTTRARARGFSLVELVIVVVIIGVIAAIAVPRISRGARGAGESALKGSLASLRNAIDMFAAEHNGLWPAGAALNTEAELIRHLTTKTDAGGAAGGSFGPYLRRGFPPVPVGPNVGATGVIMANDTTWATALSEAAADKGWVYNYESGEIICNTDDPDEGGTVTYDEY